MGFIKFIFSRHFWKHLMYMAILSVFLIFFTMMALGTYTRHGESITVPDLENLTLKQVEKQLTSKGLRYAVIDSSYSKEKLPGAILDQNPKGGAKVKENRRIYLTINAITPPSVKIPKIINSSRRNAHELLKSIGLDVGQESYIPDMARDAVLDIKLNGSSVAEGTGVPKGTKVDLILGSGTSAINRVDVPDVVGKTFKQAKIVINAYDLNVGAVIPQGTITNREHAKVYKQSPVSGDGAMTTVGSPIDLWITENTDKIETYDEVLEEYQIKKQKMEADFEAKMAAQSDSIAKANGQTSTKSIDTIIAVPQKSATDASTHE